MEQTQARVRQLLEKRGIHYDEPMWEWLAEDGRLGDWVTGESFEDCKARIKGIIDSLPPRTPRVRSEPRFVRTEGTAAFASEDDPRSAALSYAIARLVGFESSVQQFRRQYVGEAGLTWEQAEQFVKSPALARFTGADLAKWGVPIVGHRATEVGGQYIREGQRSITRREFRMDPPGVVHLFEEIAEPHKNRRRTLGMDVLRFPDKEHARESTMMVFAGSVLDDLRQLSEQIATRYPWPAYAATWFVLTDLSIIIPPLSISPRVTDWDRFTYGRISLDIAPWMSPEQVRDAYRHAQRQMLGGQNRSPGVQTLDVFRFVFSRTTAEGGRPTWEELTSEWNRTVAERNPEWSYTSPSGLWRAYNRAERELLKPGYRTAIDDLELENETK